MVADKEHLEQLLQFIHEHRSQESHFQLLYDRLHAEYQATQAGTESETQYANDLRETLEKHAEVYKENKEKGISTWAEFENMVSHFEKSVTGALHHT